MAKQYWEVDIARNEKGQVIYNNDCVVEITEFSPSGDGKFRKFQNVKVKSATNATVNMSFSLKKTDPNIIDYDLNKPFPCRIKVEEDSSEYSINGRKYTLDRPYIKGGQAPAAQPQQGQTPYQAPQSQAPQAPKQEVDWDAIAFGKTKCLYVSSMLHAGVLPSTLIDDPESLTAIVALTKWTMQGNDQ